MMQCRSPAKPKSCVKTFHITPLSRELLARASNWHRYLIEQRAVFFGFLAARSRPAQLSPSVEMLTLWAGRGPRFPSSHARTIQFELIDETQRVSNAKARRRQRDQPHSIIKSKK